MDKEFRANVEIPLQALEKAGVVSCDEKTMSLIVAAVAVNGFRSFETSMRMELPLTKKMVTIRARVDFNSVEFETSQGEFKPEVPHA